MLKAIAREKKLLMGKKRDEHMFVVIKKMMMMMMRKRVSEREKLCSNERTGEREREFSFSTRETGDILRRGRDLFISILSNLNIRVKI